MADPYLAEIRIFPFNFPPSGWAFCEGSLMPISQNTALFSLLGTTYGGDGRSTFGLPDLLGRAPLHVGGSDPSTMTVDAKVLGEMDGVETVTLLQSEIPIHTHSISALNNAQGRFNEPGPGYMLGQSCDASATGPKAYQTNTSSNIVAMSPAALTPAGGDLPHNNMMPYLALNFCIAIVGFFPPR